LGKNWKEGWKAFKKERRPIPILGPNSKSLLIGGPLVKEFKGRKWGFLFNLDGGFDFYFGDILGMMSKKER